MQQNISILEKAIDYDEEQVDMEIGYLAELDEELPNELGDSITYKTKSPYGRHFQNILTTSQALINQLDIKHVGSSKLRDNFFFLPKLPIFFSNSLQSKSGYFNTGFFCPIVFFCRQVSVKIVIFVIQLENNLIYLSSSFFVYRVTLSFWQCNQKDKITGFRLYMPI